MPSVYVKLVEFSQLSKPKQIKIIGDRNIDDFDLTLVVDDSYELTSENATYIGDKMVLFSPGNDLIYCQSIPIFQIGDNFYALHSDINS